MKLILINGPSGVGKSTVAERLHKEIPLSLLVEVDVWRRFISAYKEHKKESLELAYRYTTAGIEAYLKTGNSVIVDKVLLDAPEILDAIIALGEKYGADIHEFVLTAKKEKVVERAAQRGFSPDSLLTPQKVEELWESAEKFRLERPMATVIDTSDLSPEAVYDLIKTATFSGLSDQPGS